MEKIIKVRRTWRINPRTRIKESKKSYKRQEIKKQTKRLIYEEIKST
ncbi:MAG: hypothetical protein N2Z79_04805 [Candidatus Omnitrophica bacterium]|nr:hypothetical protein [Candidatus Omnitrophota bacterium]